MKLGLYFAVVLWSVGISTAQGGVVSLTDPEILKLRNFVAASSDPAVAFWAQSVKKNAQRALIDTPSPVDNIQIAGRLRGDFEKERTDEAFKDFQHLKNLEWAYALTGQMEYEQKARDYIVAWAKICQPMQSPSDATHLEPLIEAYDLIRPQMSLSDRQLVDQWLKSIADTLFKSTSVVTGIPLNCREAHRLKIIALVAFVLEDQSRKQWIFTSLRNLMSQNLNPDGTTFDFLQRDALQYQTFDLEPMIRTAMLYQRAYNIDLYHWTTAKGASLAQCVNFLIPFVKGEKTHAEFAHTTVNDDKWLTQDRGQAIGGDYNPHLAEKCLNLAQFFQPDLRTLIGSLTDRDGYAYPSLQTLINEVTRPQMVQQKL